MSFQLPPEYADFVSSAEALMKEFAFEEKSDFVVFSVYANTTVAADEYSIKLSRMLEELIKDYIWHEEPLQAFQILSADVVKGRSALRSSLNVLLIFR